MWLRYKCKQVKLKFMNFSVCLHEHNTFVCFFSFAFINIEPSDFGLSKSSNNYSESRTVMLSEEAFKDLYFHQGYVSDKHENNDELVQWWQF